MSGEKEVRLQESEYHRLMNAAQQTEQDGARVAAMERVLALAQRSINEAQCEETERRAAMDRTVSTLSRELQQATRDYQQQVSQFDQRLTKQRGEYLELIAQQAEYVQEQFARLKKKDQSACQRAEQWLGDAGKLLEHIANHQRNQKFAPGELSRLQADHSLTKTNVQQGNYQAAIATSQALYGKALRMQAELEFKQIEWDTHYSEALKSVREQMVEIEMQESSDWVFEGEQGHQQIAAEIDYWSDGALARFKNAKEQELHHLESDKEQIDLDELKQRIQVSDAKMAELEAIVATAKERLIASQLRANIAEDLLDELAQSGWVLSESTWDGEGADGKGWKNSFHMKLRDMGDNEMITVIIPEDTQHGKIENRVQFAYYPKNNNDARFAAQQTQKLNDTLHKIGLTQERLQCIPGHERTLRGDEQRRDFEKVKSAMK